MNKREFVRTLGGTSLAALFGENLWAQYTAQEPARLARDETFWARIRRQYVLKPDYVNLEHGYYSMQSQPVLEAFIRHVREVNREASHYMRTRQSDDKTAVRARIAQLAGVPAEELIVTRNTTESLDTVIAGFDWHAGDEAVMAAQDYGAMLDMFRLQARRYGMVNRVISLPMDPRSDEEIVQLYESAITPKTRLLMCCHLVNITGQILPVARIADMAHRHGVQVMVDGAHAFGHLAFAIPDLSCDYYAASLHKWLGSPLGAGMLWVKRGAWPTTTSASSTTPGRTRCTRTSASRTRSIFISRSGSSGSRRACATSSATGPTRCVAIRGSSSTRRPIRRARAASRTSASPACGRPISRARCSSVTTSGPWRSTAPKCTARASRRTCSSRPPSWTGWSGR